MKYFPIFYFFFLSHSFLFLSISLSFIYSFFSFISHFLSLSLSLSFFFLSFLLWMKSETWNRWLLTSNLQPLILPGMRDESNVKIENILLMGLPQPLFVYFHSLLQYKLKRLKRWPSGFKINYPANCTMDTAAQNHIKYRHYYRVLNYNRMFPSWP